MGGGGDGGCSGGDYKVDDSTLYNSLYWNRTPIYPDSRDVRPKWHVQDNICDQVCFIFYA